MKIPDLALVLLFPAILLSILVYYNYSIFKTWKDQNNLRDHGTSIRANVIDKSNFKSTKGGSTWTLKYEYNVDGTAHSSSTNVPQDYFNRTSVGQSIDIIYVPSNPKVSNIPNNYATSDYMWAIIALDVIILGSLIVGYFKYR